MQGKLAPGLARCEVNLHAMTAGVAMLSLYAWLISLKQLLLQASSRSWYSLASGSVPTLMFCAYR